MSLGATPNRLSGEPIAQGYGVGENPAPWGLQSASPVCHHSSQNSQPVAGGTGKRLLFFFPLAFTRCIQAQIQLAFFNLSSGKTRSVVPRCPLRLEHGWGVGWGMATTATSAGIGFHVPVLEGPRRAERLLTLHSPSCADLVPFEQRGA